MESNELASAFVEELQRKPLFYYDLLTRFPDRGYREIMQAWSRVREEHELSQDRDGRYYLGEADERPSG